MSCTAVSVERCRRNNRHVGSWAARGQACWQCRSAKATSAGAQSDDGTSSPSILLLIHAYSIPDVISGRQGARGTCGLCSGLPTSSKRVSEAHRHLQERAGRAGEVHFAVGMGRRQSGGRHAQLCRGGLCQHAPPARNKMPRREIELRLMGGRQQAGDVGLLTSPLPLPTHFLPAAHHRPAPPQGRYRWRGATGVG